MKLIDDYIEWATTGLRAIPLFLLPMFAIAGLLLALGQGAVAGPLGTLLGTSAALAFFGGLWLVDRR